MVLILNYIYINNLAERGFDPRTSGLWAQHASTAPFCFDTKVFQALSINLRSAFESNMLTLNTTKLSVMACQWILLVSFNARVSVDTFLTSRNSIIECFHIPFRLSKHCTCILKSDNFTYQVYSLSLIILSQTSQLR